MMEFKFNATRELAPNTDVRFSSTYECTTQYLGTNIRIYSGFTLYRYLLTTEATHHHE